MGSIAKDKTVLVTGSSGFVGRNLLRTLSKSGVRTIAAYHHGHVETLTGTFPFKCDLREHPERQAELNALVQRAQVVVHCAWLGSQDSGEGVKSESGNASLTAELCHAVRSVGGKLILLSSAGASRRSKNPFLRDKYRMELEAINSELASLDVIRLPPLFDLMGHQSPLRTALCHLLKSPLLYPRCGEDRYIKPLYVGDLVELLAERALLDAPAAVEILAANGPSQVSIAELSDLAQKAFGKGKKFPVNGVWGEHLARWLGESPAVKAKLQAPLTVLSTNKSSGSAYTGLAKAVTTANLLDIRKAWAPSV